MNAAERADLRRARWLRLRQGAGTLVLLTFVTSTSLNYTRLVRERREERRAHATQCRVLCELRDQLVSAPSTSRVTLDEQRSLAARLRSVQLDPRNVGIGKAGKQRQDDLTDDDDEEDYINQVRQAETSWSTILFGGDGAGGRIKRALLSTIGAIGRGEGPNDQRDMQKTELQARIEAEEEAAWLREIDEKYSERPPSEPLREVERDRNVDAAREEVRSAGLAPERRPRIDRESLSLRPARHGSQGDAEAVIPPAASSSRPQLLM